MKKFALSLALVALSTSAFAQDSAKLTLAREVISALHADTMIDGMMAQMKKMQPTALPADATPEQRAKAEKLQSDAAEISSSAAKKMVAQMDQIYAEVYSESELNAMKAFFTSAEGQSMLAKQPQIMQRIMPMMQQMQQELIPKMQALSAAARAETAAPTPAKAP